MPAVRNDCISARHTYNLCTKGIMDREMNAEKRSAHAYMNKVIDMTRTVLPDSVQREMTAYRDDFFGLQLRKFAEYNVFAKAVYNKRKLRKSIVHLYKSTYEEMANVEGWEVTKYETFMNQLTESDYQLDELEAGPCYDVIVEQLRSSQFGRRVLEQMALYEEDH